jgi:hypothetical protein
MGIGVAIAAVAAGVGYVANRAIRHKTAKRLAARETLADGDVYQRFYVSSGYAPEQVAELWHEIAQELHVLPEKMRPDDKFGKDIGVSWINDKELKSLHGLAAQRAQLLGLAVDPASIATVDAYVRCFAGRRES